VRNLDIVTEAD